MPAAFVRIEQPTKNGLVLSYNSLRRSMVATGGVQLAFSTVELIAGIILGKSEGFVAHQIISSGLGSESSIIWEGGAFIGLPSKTRINLADLLTVFSAIPSPFWPLAKK